MEHLKHEVQSNTLVLLAVHRLLGAFCLILITCTLAVLCMVWWYGSRIDIAIILSQQLDAHRSSRAKTVMLAREGRLDAARVRSRLSVDPIVNAEAIERINKLDSMLADVLKENGGVP